MNDSPFKDTWSAWQREVDTSFPDTDLLREGWPKPTIYKEHEAIHVLANLVDNLRRELDAARREERMRADDQAQAWRNNRALSEKIDRCEVHMREILGYEEDESDAGLEAMIVALKHYFVVTKKVGDAEVRPTD